MPQLQARNVASNERFQISFAPWFLTDSNTDRFIGVDLHRTVRIAAAQRIL